MLVAVGFIAPVADRLHGGRGQDGVSIERTNGGDGAILGDVDFKSDVAAAVIGDGVGRVLRLDAG